MADKEKMYGNPLYIIGKGCITVDKVSYNAETEPVPKDKITVTDAKALIKSGMAAEGPSKKSIIDMESAAKKKVKEQSITISEQHKKIEAQELELKSLPALQKKAESVKELEKTIAELEKAVGVAEKVSSDAIAEIEKTNSEEAKVSADRISELEKENVELRELKK